MAGELTSLGIRSNEGLQRNARGGGGVNGDMDLGDVLCCVVCLVSVSSTGF